MINKRLYVYRIDRTTKTWFIFDILPTDKALTKDVSIGAEYARRIKDGHTYLTSTHNNADWSFTF